MRTALVGLVCITVLAQASAVSAQVPSRAARAAPHVLYRTSFTAKERHRWRGLSLPGWKALSHGGVAYDGRSAASVVAPISLRLHPDYAVTITIQGTVGALPGSIPTAGFGLFVRAGSNIDSGIYAGKYVGIQGGPYLLKWGTDTAGGGAPSGITVSGLPKRNTEVFRVEVRGADVSFSVNGTPLVELPISEYLHGTRVGIWSQYVRISVRSFSIEQLDPGATPNRLPNVKLDNLAPKDVPEAFALQSGHFSTNAEFERLSGATGQDVAEIGRVLAYGVLYYAGALSGFNSLYSELTAFNSPGNAAGGYRQYLRGLRAYYSTGPYLADVDVPGTGDVAHYLSLDPPPQNGSSYRLGVLMFSRGNYAGLLDVAADPSTSTAEELKTRLVALAAIEISRIDHNG